MIHIYTSSSRLSNRKRESLPSAAKSPSGRASARVTQKISRVMVEPSSMSSMVSSVLSIDFILAVKKAAAQNGSLSFVIYFVISFVNHVVEIFAIVPSAFISSRTFCTSSRSTVLSFAKAMPNSLVGPTTTSSASISSGCLLM